MIPHELERVLCSEGLKPSGRLIKQNGIGIIRFHVEGDNRAKANGWIAFFEGGANFGSWSTGQKGTWFEDGAVKVDREEVQRRTKVAREQIKSLQDEAASKATWILNNSTTANDSNEYLTRKRVRSYGLKSYKGALVVPAYNIEGKLRTLQFISDDGTKSFLSGGEIEGCFFVIGWRKCGAVVICEGYSTGATIHQATGLPVIVAFNSGNLPVVAKGIRKKVGARCVIVIASDNDRLLAEKKPKVGNVGIKKGFDAANACGGSLIYPVFEQGESGSDFNDIGEERTSKIFSRFI